MITSRSAQISILLFLIVLYFQWWLVSCNCVSVCVSVRLCGCVSCNCISTCVSVCLCVCVTVCLSVCLWLCVCVSACPCVCVSVGLCLCVSKSCVSVCLCVCGVQSVARETTSWGAPSSEWTCISSVADNKHIWLRCNVVRSEHYVLRCIVASARKSSVWMLPPCNPCVVTAPFKRVRMLHVRRPF